MPRKRAKQLKFFVSDKELERIKSKVAASKLNQSEFLRKSALVKEIIGNRRTQRICLGAEADRCEPQPTHEVGQANHGSKTLDPVPT